MMSINEKLQSARMLTNVLPGHTCLLSHRKPNQPVCDHLTLHQLAGKVTHSVYGWIDFTGHETRRVIAEILQGIYGSIPTTQIVNDYYYAVREHKNGLGTLELLEFGHDVYRSYCESGDVNWDYDDVPAYAAEAIRNGLVNQFCLPYSRFILADPECLIMPGNQNLQHFYETFCAWYQPCEHNVLRHFS